jgi:hypothetical protein
MAVEVNGSGPTFDAGAPKELFVLRISSVGLPGPRNVYAAGRDGQRFLVNSIVGDPSASPTTVVLNWTADLKK